jgi:hypothetical protein
MKNKNIKLLLQLSAIVIFLISFLSKIIGFVYLNEISPNYLFLFGLLIIFVSTFIEKNSWDVIIRIIWLVLMIVASSIYFI